MTEFVERPQLGSRRGRSKYPVEAIIETAANGKAIVMSVGNASVRLLRCSLQVTLAKRGYRISIHDNHDGTITAWSEKK